MKKNRMKLITLGLCAVIAAGALSGCSGGKGGSDTLVAVDGRLTEQKLLVRMAKKLIEANTDLEVKIKDEMTAVNAYNELKAGNGDLMVSYDGTVLTTFLHLDPKDVTEGKSLYDFTNEKVAEESKMTMLAKLGINNTYTIAVTQAVMDQHQIKTVTELASISDQLVFGAEHEFFAEEGSAKFKPFCEAYNITFKDTKPVDLNLKYSAVSSQNLDCTVVYATDGLNRKANLRILEDDKKFFPEYNGAYLVRDDIFERFKDKAPDLREVLNQLEGRFTDETMTDLTYAVDVEGKDVDQIAEQFLKDQGLIK